MFGVLSFDKRIKPGGHWEPARLHRITTPLTAKEIVPIHRHRACQWVTDPNGYNVSYQPSDVPHKKREYLRSYNISSINAACVIAPL
jgi:hypothetical protein